MPQENPASDEASARARTIHPDELAWALGSLCQLRRVPFDKRLLLSPVQKTFSEAGRER
jgi:hypothetical protein